MLQCGEAFVVGFVPTFGIILIETHTHPPTEVDLGSQSRFLGGSQLGPYL